MDPPLCGGVGGGGACAILVIVGIFGICNSKSHDHSQIVIKTPTIFVSVDTIEICVGAQRERFDTHDHRRGLANDVENSHCATTRAMRRARNPQRVRSDVFRQPYPGFRSARK